MNNKVKLYYLLLASIIGIKIVATIFSNGMSVHHGKKIAQLQVQKNNLIQQHMLLNSELSNKSSLGNIIEEYDILGYVAISKPIVINASNTVASN